MKDTHQKHTTQIYNNNAQKYKDGSKDFIFPDNMFEYFLDYLGENAKILDVGCAYGRDILRLKKLGYSACGLEISHELIAQAETEIKDHIVEGDMTQLEEIFQGESFDGIISSASIVHMDHEVGIYVMKQIYSLLKDSGYFYLSLKVATERKVEFKESISTPGCNKKYVYYASDEIEEIAKQIGFSIVQTHIWTPHTDTWKILILQK